MKLIRIVSFKEIVPRDRLGTSTDTSMETYVCNDVKLSVNSYEPEYAVCVTIKYSLFKMTLKPLGKSGLLTYSAVKPFSTVQESGSFLRSVTKHIVMNIRLLRRKASL